MFKRFRSKQVHFTSDEREALLAAADMYLSGMEEAREQTIADHTIESPEELLNLTDGLEKTRWNLITAKKKVEHAY